MSGRLDRSDMFGEAFPPAKFEEGSIEHEEVEEVWLPVRSLLIPRWATTLTKPQDILGAMNSPFLASQY